MLTLETCGDFLFLETCFAVRITGKSKQHFDCCSIILKFSVEGKKSTNLYRYIYRGRENEVKYVLIHVDIKGVKNKNSMQISILSS